MLLDSTATVSVAHSASIARRMTILCHKASRQICRGKKSQQMSPTAIQIMDKRPLGWSIYPTVQFMMEREREGREREESSLKVGSLPHSLFLKKLSQADEWSTSHGLMTKPKRLPWDGPK